MNKAKPLPKKMNKENIAVNVVDQIISCTELLSPDFARNDRTPTWDGFIYAYKNSDRRKDQMYGRAPVQIKGTTNNPQNSKGVYFRVSYSDMENFREDGGALFFIVYIKSVEEQEVFYASLLPFVLNDLLKKHYGKKSFLLRFQAMPRNTKDVEDLVINFVENRKRQSSPSRDNWNLEEIVKSFNIEQPSIKYRFHDVYRYKDPFDYLFNHFTEMYVPVEIAKQEFPIGAAKLELMQTTINLPVNVDGNSFFDSYDVRRDKNGSSIIIGNGVLSISFNEETTQLHFSVKGSLTEQIEQAEFLLAVIDSGQLEIGGESIRLESVATSEKEKSAISELRKKHEWNKDLALALNKLGVRGELELSGWNDSDVYYADQLIKAFVYKEPVKLPKTMNLMSIIVIGNLAMGVICERLNKDFCRLYNMFDEERDYYMTIAESEMPTSLYVILKKENFLRISNLNYERIAKSVKRFKNPDHYASTNRLLLEMLKAYDDTRSDECINAAIDIAAWLYNEEASDYNLLNWYQSVYRKNPNDGAIDYSRLRLIMDESEDIKAIAGAAIISGDYDKAKTMIESMTEDEKTEFTQFPIYNMLMVRST